MGTAHMLLFTFLTLCIFKQGWAAQCNLTHINVSQAKTGYIINGKPEFEVIISNNCVCSQTNVTVQCNGFSSAEEIDPSIFTPYYGPCLVNDGNPIFQDLPVKFQYASGVKHELIPINSIVECSF